MKSLYLIDEVQISPSILNGSSFNKVVKDGKQSAILVRDNTFDPSKKYTLKVTAPVTHGMRLTLNNAVYLPHKLASSAKSFYSPYKKPVIKEHVTGGGGLFGSQPAPDPVGRVFFAHYEDYFGSLSSQLEFKDSLKLLQDLMRNGQIYDENFNGHGALIATAHILDKDAIEKFIDERVMTFSVGGRTKEVYSPFNGKHVMELEEDDLGPYDEHDGMEGFKVVGELVYDELSITSTPADVLAKVSSLELNEFRLTDSVREKYNIRMNSDKRISTEDGLFDLEGVEQMAEKQYEVKDYCGPDKTYPVTSKEEALVALQSVKESQLDAAIKSKVEKAIQLKLKDFVAEEKSVFLDKQELKKGLESLTSFEVLDFLEGLKDSLNGFIDKELLAELLGVKDSDSTSKRLLESELKDLKLKLHASEEELKVRMQEVQDARKSFVTLAKAIRDNLELTSFEGVGENSKLAEEYNSLLTDSFLFAKVQKIFEGINPNQQLDNSTIVSEVQSPNKPKEPLAVSDNCKFFEGLYKDKKTQDGKVKADAWLQNLKDIKYITEQDFDLLIKEA